MERSVNRQSKPVFVIGSPRSGTSILTWALGQHPNLLLTEESNWLGSFATQAAAAHAQGSSRAQRSQLSALGITRDIFLSGLGDAIDQMILTGRTHLEAASRAIALDSPHQVNPEFAISRDPGESKSRWIDGTPEYSLQIPALLALFPEARFVHILRDVDQVAASLIAFRDERDRPIVGSAEEAYGYWMRTAQACVDAEEVLGPDIVLRVRYEDLVADGEGAIRRILDFLGESFVSSCLEPLERRINSSFPGEAKPQVYPDVRSAVIEQARHSSAEWLASTQSVRANADERTRWQAGFDTAVMYALGLEKNWETAQRMLSQSRLSFGVSGLLFLGNWLFALVLWSRSDDPAATIWLVVACAALVVYLWLRRAGLRSVGTRVFDMAVHLIRARG